MSSEISKTSDSHRLLLNLSDKIDLKRSNKYVALSNLSICTWKNIKQSYYKTINLKYQLPSEMKNLNYLMNHFCIIKYIIKKHQTVTDNPPIRIYTNKTENNITFRIKTGYYFQLLAPETTN